MSQSYGMPDTPYSAEEAQSSSRSFVRPQQPPRKNEDELNIAAIENWAEFKRGYDDGGHFRYVEFANLCDNFFNGEQWDEAVRKRIEAEGRPVLTINLSKRTVNNIMGHYDGMRADITFKPRTIAVEEQAHTMTLLFDQIMESNGYNYVERDMFQNALITDRGYLDVRLNFDTNVLGDIEIQTVDSRDVVLDPEAKKYDPRTWSQVMVIRWLSLNQIEMYWGKEAADRVQSMVDTGDWYGSESVRFSDPLVKAYGQITHGSVEERRIRAVRVIDRQYKQMVSAREFVDLLTGDTKLVPDNWEPERVAAIAQKYGLGVRKRVQEKIKWCVSVDQIGLFEGWSPYDEFTIVPYFPYFTTGRPTGVMRDLISPQEQLNKTESQELHIVNTTANSGWMVEAGSLVNMTDQEIEERGAETGLVLIYGRNRTPPQKIQPNTVPTGLERLSQKAAIYLSDIHGVSSLMGAPPNYEVSGVALERAQSGATTGLQPLFSNLAFTRYILARVILSCVQRYYTEMRILRVTGWRDPQEPQIDFMINNDVLNNITIGKYDIIVASAPSRDNQDEVQFAEALQLREAGVPVPGYHVVLASKLRGKRAIAEEVKQLEGLAPPTPEQVEMQNAMQEIQVRNAMAQIQKLEAEAINLEAMAQLSQAKAQTALENNDRLAYESETDRFLRIQEARHKMVAQAAEMMNKVEIAEIHSGAKASTTRYETVMKSFDNRMRAATDIKIAEMKPKPKALPAPKKKA